MTKITQTESTQTELHDAGAGEAFHDVIDGVVVSGRYMVVSKGATALLTDAYPEAARGYIRTSNAVSTARNQRFFNMMKHYQAIGMDWYEAHDAAMDDQNGRTLGAKHPEPTVLVEELDVDFGEYLALFGGNEEAYLRSLPGYSQGF